MKKFLELLKKLFPEKAEDIAKIDIPEAPELDNQQVQVMGDKNIEELKSLVKTQQAEIQKLLNELNEVKKKELEHQKLLEEKAKREREEQIQKVIDEAIKNLKIPAKNEDLIKKYKTLLEKDFESGKAVIENLPTLQKTEEKKETEQKQPEPKMADNPILKTILERNQILN